MPGPVAAVVLTDDERAQSVSWSRQAKSANALALRSRIVLAGADRLRDTATAAELPISSWISRPPPRPGSTSSSAVHRTDETRSCSGLNGRSVRSTPISALDHDLERRPPALRLDQDRRPDPQIHRSPRTRVPWIPAFSLPDRRWSTSRSRYPSPKYRRSPRRWTRIPGR